jgi:mannose/fructose/N-acetylgalactosamine-specific phosphotransferase system component IIC
MNGEPVGWVLAALLGAVLTLDGTSVGQFMISRPLVAATLAGWMAGSATTGAAIGVVLEALHLAVLPVGASRYPDAPAAAVAAGTVFTWAGGGYDALLALTVFTLGWEQLGSWTITRLRTWIGVRLLAEGDEVTLARVERRHLLAIAADGARGLALTAAGLAVAAGMVSLIRDAGVSPGIARLAPGIAAAAALGAALRLFGGRRLPWFAVGAVVALGSLWAQR